MAAAYLTTAQADTYFTTRLYTEKWDEAGETDKAAALLMASNAVDRCNFAGRRKVSDQERQFPRCYPPLSYLPNVSWYWPCDDTTPQAILDAVCEEALELLTRGNSKRRRMQKEGVSSFSLGGLSESYAQGVSSAQLLSFEAYELLRPYMATTAVVR